MKVFISWSGDLSHKVAILLKDWLQDVIQSIEPYVSSENIDKGARWFSDISGQLENTEFGVICLTPDNLSSPWILFEAGALSKSLNKSKVCPFLIKLSHSDVVGPLVQFQACTPKKDDLLKLIHTINQALGDDKIEDDKLKRSFDRWWPEFEERYFEVSENISIEPQTSRSNKEMIEEILQLCRGISQSVQIPAGYQLTEADKRWFQEKKGEKVLRMISTMAKNSEVQVLSGSVARNIMKLSVVKETLNDEIKDNLLKIAGDKGYDLRIRKI
jgi:hypothetical protein